MSTLIIVLSMIGGMFVGIVIGTLLESLIVSQLRWDMERMEMRIKDLEERLVTVEGSYYT